MAKISTLYRFTNMSVSSQFPESHTVHKCCTTHLSNFTESGLNCHRKFLRARSDVGLLPPVLVLRLRPRRDNYSAVEKAEWLTAVVSLLREGSRHTWSSSGQCPYCMSCRLNYHSQTNIRKNGNNIRCVGSKSKGSLALQVFWMSIIITSQTPTFIF